ncbi:MAG TPA: DUF4388 domain-containing protein [Thermoanaerobaculia bacterium]|nr:DUF4388 domain-containing protein [Thermoanaerobaculia bacterium]
MAVEGTLELFKLPEILQLVSQQKKTGILTVQGQQDIVAISFLNGGIVAADALNHTLEEGLGQVLVAEGLLSASQLGRATSDHQAAGGRLLDVLVERRYVDRQQLLKALRLQTRLLLQDLLRWDKGDFKFYSGDEVFYEEGFVPISVEELLLHAGEAEAEARARPAAAPPAAPRPAPAAVPPAAPAAAPRGGLRVVRSSEPAPAVRPAGPAPAKPVPVPAPAAVVHEATAGAFRKMTVERPVGAPVFLRLMPALLAAGLAVLLGAVLLTRPGALLLPFPWQDGERAAVIRDQQESLYLKIDRAAKTFFLLEGRFPDGLGQLRDAGLLATEDLRDLRGRPLQYTPAEESYLVQPIEAGQPAAGEGASEAVSGNFLLDPEFLSVTSESSGQPLVLLD